ncbi:uncharacterized protein LOC143174916 isoform X1 [Nomia melanderi]|uniref:uncharacterized protein LOC143174916 isoform X1 n=1 Tax=Nomia melanderi TaxID=2448451 RepID=UPI003FCEB776
MNEILQKMSNKRKQKAQQHIPTPKIARNNSSLSQRNTKETSASKDKSNKNLSMEEIFNNLKKQNDELRIQNEAQQIQINELLSKLSTFEECGPSKPDSNKDPKIYNQENPTATISPKNSSLPQDTPNSKDTSQKQKSEAPTSQPSSTLTQQKEDQLEEEKKWKNPEKLENTGAELPAPQPNRRGSHRYLPLNLTPRIKAQATKGTQGQRSPQTKGNRPNHPIQQWKSLRNQHTPKETHQSLGQKRQNSPTTR